VLGVTRTRPSEEREAAMRAEGITHRYRSDVEASVRCGTRWPYVLFSASPRGNDDYAATVANALNYWDKDAPGARFVFTSSAGVYAEDGGGVVTEASPVGSGPRSERLLAAEKAVLAAGGCVVRLAGLYLEDRGAHNYWLMQDEIAQRPDGLINQVHYRDAANCAVAALLHGTTGSVYVAADDQPLTREQICIEACRAPRFAGRHVPKFTGTDGGVGKVIDSTATRAAIGWKPQYKTFGAFVDTLA
jgi:nucleoside-diphosphate-sugar epimerase